MTTIPSQCHIEGSVVLQIVKHSREESPAFAYGKILAHIDGDVLQIVGGAAVSEQENFSTDGPQNDFKQAEHCGLYSSVTFDDSNDALDELIGAMILHQKHNPASVLVLYNPTLTQRGIFSFRVVRVSQRYIELDQQGKFSADRCAELGLGPADIFEEVLFSIHNPHLIFAYLFELHNDIKSSNLISSHREVLDPAPSIIANQLVEKLVEKHTSQINPASTYGPLSQALLDQYSTSLERYQREQLWIQRQKQDYTRRVEEVRLENQRRQQARLPTIHAPEVPNTTDPSLHDIQLFSVRINTVAADLSTVTELAHMKQTILKRLITQEGQIVIE